MDINKRGSIKENIIMEDIADALNINRNEIKFDSSSDYFQEWDSMGTINLISFIESKYECKFELMEMPLFNSVKSILELLKKKGFDIEHN